MSNNGNTRALHFHRPPRRVVSLVPSMTESMVDLGFGDALVGITDYCIHPAEGLTHLPRLGGTKDPNIGAILALEPDLVLANWEENTRQTVEALEAQGVPVWVSFPQSVAESMQVLWAMVNLFNRQEAALRLKSLETALDWARRAGESQPRLRYFCPIWYKDGDAPWWMTFNRRTYSHDLLDMMGGENVFADRERRYPLAADLVQAPPQDPGERDTRYPRISLKELQQSEPQLILLPDEPFIFEERHEQEIKALLADSPAVRHGRVHRIDGSLITWHGIRLGRALTELPDLFS